MDKETREFLEIIRNELQDFRKETNNRFDGLETKVDNLESGQEEIKALIQELDPKNATRHLELKKDIEELRKDLVNVEIITSSNWNEIAKLKQVK